MIFLFPRWDMWSFPGGYIIYIYIWPAFGVLSERLWNRWIPRCFFSPLDERSTTRHAPILREKQNDPRTCWDLLGCQGNCHALRITGPCYRAVWMCIAGVWDLQTTSSEIPWFLGWRLYLVSLLSWSFSLWWWILYASRLFFMFYFWSLKCVQLGV